MVDVFDGKDVQSRRKIVELELSRMAAEIEEVDRKVRYYLADRSKNPHPRHLDLIEKIQRYRIDPTVSNRHLETLLENLQWKIFYYQRSWRQMWENAESSRGPRAAETVSKTETVHPKGPESETKGEKSPRRRSSSQYSLDHLWSIQQEKIISYGAEVEETRAAFNQRIAMEYKVLSEIKQNGQEIVMTFDPDSQKCRLNLKDN